MTSPVSELFSEIGPEIGPEIEAGIGPEAIAPIVLAIDAMGGDKAPFEIVKGAVLGARKYGVCVELVGPKAIVEAELAKHNTAGLNIRLIEATEVIAMDEHPATALRKKKDASVLVAAKRVGSGHAQGLIAAGSTGAAMAAALFGMGRIKGIDRPAIGVTLPSLGTPCLLIDGGANADCQPEWLIQFAQMGQIFMQSVYGLSLPRVGLLNIGSEEGKGNAFVNKAFDCLKTIEGLNFIGNIEGRDLFLGGADVAVCDGFTGNVALKSAEGVATLLGKLIKRELTANLGIKLSALLSKPAFDRAKKEVDHEEFGGALLLGVKGICVIAHGGSSAYAIENAIRVAKQAVEQSVVAKIEATLSLSESQKPSVSEEILV